MGYSFIIDTDSYSGNFERQMCAFVTGHTGDCGVGQEEKMEFKKDYQPVQGVEQVENEEYEDFYRPVKIATTPGIWNNGMGFHFKDGEEEIALKEYQKEVKDYYEAIIKRTEAHRGKNILNWTDEAIDGEVARCKKTIQEAMDLKKVHKYPAYQSVLIHFETVPSEESVEFMKKRAYEFAARNNIAITGFRIK